MTGKTFTGTPGLDSIIGTDGDDTIRPGDGSDYVSGGAGIDTLILDHPVKEYRLTRADPAFGQGNFALAHRPTGDVKSLYGIERFKFADTPVFEWNEGWGMLAVQSAAPTTGKVDVTDALAKLDAARAAVAKIGSV